MPEQNRAAVAIVSYAGVLYAAVAVFAVTLFYSTAVDHGPRHEYPVEHWILAAGVSALVAGVLLLAVNALLRDTRTARTRT
ncbi:hypothetical protein [Williamsia maris]|nr:hypothetical protein [Williamsia maris]